MRPDGGPIIDWMDRLLAGLHELLAALLAALVAGLHRVEARVSSLESGVSWLPWKVAAVFLAAVALHAWLTRPRKGP